MPFLRILIQRRRDNLCLNFDVSRIISNEQIFRRLSSLLSITSSNFS